MAGLTDPQFHRYARHIILDEIGEAGQEKLLDTRVLVVGAGGLGAPLLLYLAAAGIGTIGIVDDDVVELSNLQRQIIHTTARLGHAKTESAAATLKALDPEVRVKPYAMRLQSDSVDALIAEYDIVADGSDNFETRFLLNDSCAKAGKTLVAAALLRFEAQLFTFKPYLGDGHPCYRCVFPEAPPAGSTPRCEEAGILGAVAGVVGTLQAVEVIKEILNLGDSLSGTMLMYDAVATSFYRVKIPKDPSCTICGTIGGRKAA